MANLQTDIDLFINRAQQKIGALGEEMRDLDSTSGVDVVWQISLIKELKAAIYLFQNNTIPENFAYKIIHYLSKKADLYVIPLAVFDDTVLVQNVLLPTGGFTTGPQGPQGDAATISIGTTTTIAYTLPATVTNSGNTKAAIFNFAIPQGTPGTNGTNGDTGWSAVYSIVNDGTRRVLEVVSWIGGTGTPPTPINVYLGTTGYVSDITLAVDIRGIPGIDGTIGNDGNNGWSPIYAIVNDSTRRVLQIIGWTGGSGSAPATGDYIYSGGQTADISIATDIRGPQGLQGDPFTINARGNLSDRNLYDNQGTGYTFLAEDTGDVYIKNSPLSGDWSPPISFVGEKGWSPLFNTVEDGQRRLIQLSDWVGGAGLPPDNQGYLYPGGFTLNVSDATDFRGDRGEFFIDASGPLSDRSTYNSQLRPFAYFANDNGNIYLKNSNTPADWTVGFQFTGSRGPAGPVGSAGTSGIDAFTVTTSNFTVPAINSNVNVDVLQDSWMAIGQIVFIESAGYYQVVTPISGTTVTLKNIGVSTNAVPTTIITFGKKVSPSGVAGMSPSITASNGLTLTGSDIALGGTLTVDTTIDGAFDFLLGTITLIHSFEVMTDVGALLSSVNGLESSLFTVSPSLSELVYTNTGTSIESGFAINNDGVQSFYSGASAVTSLFVDILGVGIYTDSSEHTAYFRTDNLSADATLQTPDSDGILLISGGTNTLNADTAIDGAFNLLFGSNTPLSIFESLTTSGNFFRTTSGNDQSTISTAPTQAFMQYQGLVSNHQVTASVNDTSVFLQWTDQSTINSSLTVDTSGVGINTNIANAFNAYLKSDNLTANRTLQLPNASDTLIGRATTDTFTNKSGNISQWTNNSGYLTANQSITLSGEASGSGTIAITVTLLNSAVIGKILTGYASGAGTVSATDSILQAIQKLNGNISALITGVSSVSGTTNRITSTGGSTPAIDISATFEALLGKVANPLSQFASTTSAQLAGIISDETGSGSLVFATSPTLTTPLLGTPTSGVLTNCTGTAAGLTAGNVTTNANLTGPITSSGNATSIASQTGTGTKFVMDTSPTLVTPVLGVATATSVNKVTITSPATSATLTIADGSSLITSGAFGITLTATSATNVTLPTSGTLVGGTGTSGQISYWNGTNSQTGNSSLIYDATNIFVGIGGTPAARLHLSGNISAAAWTTNGIGIRDQAATYTDTTSATGTVAAMYGNYFGVKTFNSTNASVVVTQLYGNFFEAPLVTGNVTATSIYAAAFAGDIRLTGGNRNFTFSNALNITTSSSGSNIVVSPGISFNINTSAQSSGSTAAFNVTQASNTGGGAGIVTITGGAVTSQTTATNITDINFNLSAVMKVVDGTTTLMRGMLITGRTYTPQTSALTVTNASALDVVQSIAGSGTTITSNYTQRWLFDINNYIGVSISSTGSATFGAVGTNATFTFSQSLIAGLFLSNGNATNANFAIYNGVGGGQTITAASLIFAGATTVNTRVTMRGSTSSSPSAGNSYSSFIVGTQDATIAGSGTHALFANMVINPVSITAGAGALTSSASLYINGAASGAVTNYSLWIASGTTRLDGDLKLSTIGNGIYIKEGSNATMGTGTLSAGTLVVSNTKVTANSRIFLTDEGGGILANIGALYISARSAGTSFTVSSSNALDTSTFSWIIIEPAP